MFLEGEMCVLLIGTQVVVGARLALQAPGLPALAGPGSGDAVPAPGLGPQEGVFRPIFSRSAPSTR